MDASVLYISGSPREGGNTEQLLALMQDALPGDLLRVMDYDIKPCRSCWACGEHRCCTVEDDFTQIIMPRMLAAEAIVIGCPVYFNNVPSQTKALIDRTWGYRGSLTNKIAGAVVVGRKYGAEAAIQALHAFYLKHNMIVANRGVCALGFKYGDVVDDDEAHTAAVGLAKRIQALIEMLRQ